MDEVVVLDIAGQARDLAEAVNQACDVAEVDELANQVLQHRAVQRVRELLPEATGTFMTIRSLLEEEGVLLVANAPAADDKALIVLGAATAPASLCDANGPRLVDQLTPEASGEDALKAQNQRTELDLHTDACAQEVPPDLVGLACIANDGLGGTSILLRVDDVVQRMGDAGLGRTIDLLQTDFPFARPRHVNRHVVNAPILCRAPNDRYHVRFRRENLDCGLETAARDTVDSERIEALLEFSDQLQGVAQSSMVLRLRPGDYLLFDNRRFLHGRTEIDTDARRLLKRIYFTHPETTWEPLGAAS